MAQRILRPTVTSFLDLALAGTGSGNEGIQMEEIPVTAGSALDGVMLKDSGIRQYNLIIAMKRSDGTMRLNPSFETHLAAGETVITVGKSADLKALEPS